MQDSIKYILQILPQMLEGLKITIKLFVVTRAVTASRTFNITFQRGGKQKTD